MIFSLHTNIFLLKGTSQFCSTMNSLFDIFNVKKDKRISTPEGNFLPEQLPYGAEKELQDNFLEEAFAFVSAMRKRGVRNPALLPFQKGWLLNIRALQQLHQNLQRMYPVENILICTINLNQDPLERMFGVIRGMGGTHTAPSALEFKYRIRKYLIMRNPEVLIKSSATNLEVDDMNLINLTGLVKSISCFRSRKLKNKNFRS